MMRRKKTTEKGQDLNQYKIGDVVCANIKGYPDGWPGVVRRVSTDNIIVYFKSDDDEFTFNRKKVKPFHLNETKMNETARKIKNSQMRDMFIQDCEWARRKMRPSIVICPSGLTNDKKKNILKLCCNNSSKMSEVFTEDVTHVVIKTDPEGSRICDRTLKFFQSIAKKCWLLDYQWIVDSVSAGHLLPEEDFEVIGDTVTEKKHYGPKFSRLAESPLLKDYQIYFYRRTCDISKDDLEDLATSCGGSLLDSAKQLTPESRQLAVACVDEFTSDYDKKQVTTMTMGLQTVSHDWLLDSITVFEVQDLTEYLITDKEHQTGDNEMNETEEKQDIDNVEVTIKKDALSMSGMKTKSKESIDSCNNNADFVNQYGHTDEKNGPDFLPDSDDEMLDTDHDEVNLKKEALSMSGLKDKGKDSIGCCNSDADFGGQDDDTDEIKDPDFLPDSDDEMLDTDHDEVNLKKEALSMSGLKDKGKDSIGCCNSDADFGGQDDDTDEIKDPDFLPDSDDEMLDTDHDEVNLKREALSISRSKAKDKKRKRTDDCNSDGKSKVMVVSDSDSNPESEVFPMLNCKQGGKKQKSGVKVQMAHNGNKRKWDKKHYCMYCGKSSTNIRKHYFSKQHRSESKVQRILSFPLHSKDRSLALEELRNAGDYKHNYEVIKSGEGTLVPWRNVTEETEASQLLPCEYCLAFFMKTELWRHHTVCKFRKDSNQKKYRKVFSKAADLLPCETEVSDGFKTNILQRMSGDQISLVARNDTIITKLGEKLYKKHGHLEHMYNYIGQKMREMARLLITIREESDITTMEDLIEPSHFPVALKCTQRLCGYEEDTNTYRNPSLALKLGYSLKKCALIQKANALIEEDDEKRKKAENFIAVHELMWPNDISSAALTTLKAGKWNKPSPLPLTEDVSKLQTLVKEKLKTLSASLSTGIENSKPEKNVYAQPSEVALVKLVMFNRRRGGEAERLTIESYQQKSGNNAPIKEIEDSLSPMEKKMCSLFQRVEIRGKKGRRVPVLLTKDLIEAIDLLLKARESVGVSNDNPYVFARMNYGSNKAIRASDALRKYARLCGVKQVENITSTKLRKHIATVSQIMNFGSNDLEQLAKFMGHDIDVHRSFYRLPESTIQVAKLGKFLLALDSGEVSKYSSCTLDDVTLEDDDVVVEDDQEGEDIERDSDLDDNELQLEQVTPQSSPTAHPKPCHSKRGQVILNTKQQTCLKQMFRENIMMRKELKMIDCKNAIAANDCLNGLGWKKIKKHHT